MMKEQSKTINEVIQAIQTLENRLQVVHHTYYQVAGKQAGEAYLLLLQSIMQEQVKVKALSERL